MVKKIFCSIVIGSLFALVSAELYKPVRFIEFGVASEAAVSNNYFSVDQIMTKQIALNLQKIAKELPNKGLSVDFSVHEQNFLNVNIRPDLRLGFSANLEGSGNITFGKDLFDFLGSGFSAGEHNTYETSSYGDVFFDLSFSFHTVIRQTYGLTVTPSYYVPLLYVGDTTGTVDINTDSSGRIRATAEATVDVYSAMCTKPYVKNTFSGSDIGSDIAEALHKGGFDIAVEVERQLLESLDVGVFTRLPIWPGKVDYMMREKLTASFTGDNLLSNLMDKKSDLYEMDYHLSDIMYSSVTPKKVWRPFRLGAEAAWRPFGKWCTFRPKLALVVRRPYTSDVMVYPEYFLGAEFALFNIVGLNFATAYENKVFFQQIGFMLNFKVVQIDIKASLRGASFVNSFNYTGAGVYTGVKIGF